MADLSQREFMGWLAYAGLEPVGNPVEIERPEDRRKRERADFERGMRQMMARQR